MLPLNDKNYIKDHHTFISIKGASPEKKKLVGNPNSQIEIILDGNKYTQVTNAGSKTFTIGEEYEQGPGEVGGKAKVAFNEENSKDNYDFNPLYFI